MAKMITPQKQDYSKWYVDIVTNAQLADYSPVKGCMVIRPNGYALWENMRRELDAMFHQTGHRNAYFPLLIPESFMQKEAEHVEGFAPECAVVTHGGGKKLEEPLYIRPTSETIIWSMYAKWINSYRDLPLLINQWANIMRWEKRTRLFLRTTEFLWQEGHTAHATREEGEAETLQMIDIYERFARDYLAIPVLKGRKTEKEKFAGALHTFTIEAMMKDGKALQAGTSHNLGQNFAKAFNVTFLDKDGERKLVWATSWGVSTRLIGGLIMVHSDDNGLVVPPRIAATDFVIIPIWRKDEDREAVVAYARKLAQQARELHMEVILDDSDQYKPGWKYAQYEMMGVPFRVEIGPREVAQEQLMVVARHNRQRTSLGFEQFFDHFKGLQASMQADLLQQAKAYADARTSFVTDYNRFQQDINDQGFFIVPWCGDRACEDKLQQENKATIRLIHEENCAPGYRCLMCQKPANTLVVVARAY